MNAVTEKISTVDERDILVNFLEQLDQNIYNLKIDVKNFVEKNAPFHTSQSLFDYFGVALNSRETESISRKCSELKDELEELPTVTLTMVFEPKSEFVHLISQKVRQEYSENILFDFVINQNLVAGAVVEGSGRRIDASLAAYFAKRKEENGL